MKGKAVHQEEILETKGEEEENSETITETGTADAVDGSVKLKDEKNNNVIR